MQAQAISFGFCLSPLFFCQWNLLAGMCLLIWNREGYEKEEACKIPDSRLLWFAKLNAYLCVFVIKILWMAEFICNKCTCCRFDRYHLNLGSFFSRSQEFQWQGLLPNFLRALPNCVHLGVNNRKELSTKLNTRLCHQYYAELWPYIEQVKIQIHSFKMYFNVQNKKKNAMQKAASRTQN